MPVDHIGIAVSDLEHARAYYDELMPLLNFEPFVSGSGQFSYRPVGGKPGTYVFFYPAEAGQATGVQHLAFFAKSRDAVSRVYARAVEMGSPIVSPPRRYPQYHEHYYAAFWRDPDGTMIEIVCHRAP